jgi:RNA polymerase sigma-70 factor (ECF subfamily)
MDYTSSMDTKSDAELVLLCQRGESVAFGVLYDRYIEKIYRFIYYKTFSKETAEDITSDVFHKAFERLASFDAEKGTFSAWIYRIARNSVIDHYRTQKRTVPIEDAFDIGEEDHTIEEHDALITLGKVRTFMEKLSPRQREIITLRIWEELSYREIAELIGGTEDSAKMAFSRAMKELREKCGPMALLYLSTLIIETLPFHEVS